MLILLNHISVVLEKTVGTEREKNNKNKHYLKTDGLKYALIIEQAAGY